MAGWLGGSGSGRCRLAGTGRAAGAVPSEPPCLAAALAGLPAGRHGCAAAHWLDACQLHVVRQGQLLQLTAFRMALLLVLLGCVLLEAGWGEDPPFLAQTDSILHGSQTAAAS